MKIALCALALLFPALCLSEPYAGASIGFGFADDTYEDDDELWNVEDESPLFRVFFGYKWEDKGWGLATELAYLYSHDMDIRAEIDDINGIEYELDEQFDIKAVGVDIIFSYEIGRLSPFISVGYYQWDANIAVENEVEDTDVGLSFEGDNVSYGAGVDIRINRHFSTRLEWRRLDMEIGEWDDLAHEALMLGMSLRF